MDTYTITTEVVNAKKYHYQGSKVMDITYTNTGDKVNLSSFNYNNKVSSSLFYENVNGDIVQKYLDATNTLNETEMGVSFDDYFNIKNVVKDLMPTFLKINDNVYRSFSTSAYQLLNIFTFTSFGNPLYVDAVMSSNKVDYFRFGFMEIGIESDGDFLHLLIKCDISEALEVKLPVKCEVDENTTLINDAFNYFENNDFIMHAISDNELIKRDIYKVDGYYIDLITMYNTYGDIYYYGGMGYYLSADTDIKFFNVSLNIEGVVEITSANIDSLEYFGGFNVAGEIFVIGENNKYYLKENVENIGYNILTGYNGSPGLGNIISSSFEMEIIDNKISSYSYEYASSSRNGRETINFTYNNLKLDASLKEKIDLFLSI